MFCQKCGHQNPDNADVCASCGTSLKLQPAVEPAQPQYTPVVPQPVQPQYTPVAPQPAQPQYAPVAPQPKSNKGVIIALICVILAMAVGVGAFFIFGNKGDKSSSKEDTEANVVETSASAEEVAKKFTRYTFEFNVTGLLDCYHEKYIEAEAAANGMTASAYSQLLSSQAETQKKELEAKYGLFSVSNVNVASCREILDSELDTFKQSAVREYGLTVSAVYEIKVTYFMTFESYPDKSSEGKITTYVAKIGSDWYVIDSYNN